MVAWCKKLSCTWSRSGMIEMGSLCVSKTSCNTEALSATSVVAKNVSASSLDWID